MKLLKNLFFLLKIVLLVLKTKANQIKQVKSVGFFLDSGKAQTLKYITV
jgi:hypothetical protein